MVLWVVLFSSVVKPNFDVEFTTQGTIVGWSLDGNQLTNKAYRYLNIWSRIWDRLIHILFNWCGTCRYCWFRYGLDASLLALYSSDCKEWIGVALFIQCLLIKCLEFLVYLSSPLGPLGNNMYSFVLPTQCSTSRVVKRPTLKAEVIVYCSLLPQILIGLCYGRSLRGLLYNVN